MGVAVVDLVPADPVPLAGFIGGIAQPYVGVNSRCQGKALTIATERASVTILAADLLLIDDRLSQAILERTGLPREQVYFTATHTHGGPGGWGIHPLERLVAGTYDPAVFDLLADRLADVIVRSRSRNELAEVAFVQVAIPGMQRNRIDPAAPTNDALSAWVFRSTTPLPNRGGVQPVLATLATFGAHATVAHPTPPRLGGDYPAAFAAALPERVDAGIVLFAAGTVGDSGPVRVDAPNEHLKARAYGRTLADRLAPAIQSARFVSEIELGNGGFAVDLPPVQVPFRSAGLRLSPLATWWVGGRTTYLQVVRLGPAILVGFPGDYASHLGRRLEGSIPVVATSFNGDYKGYLTSRATFQSHLCYETRWMSFFGPDLGDDLTDLAQRRIATLAPARR